MIKHTEFGGFTLTDLELRRIEEIVADLRKHSDNPIQGRASDMYRESMPDIHHPEIFVSELWVRAVIEYLNSKGYEIVKKSNN